MSTFVTHFENLLRQCEAKERQLAEILNFSSTGGEFRLRVTVDHPDPQVREAVENLAATYTPNKIILSQVLKGAQTEYRRAKEEFVKTASIHPIATEGPAS
ncbi:hypothetical protein ABE527_02610 [Brucella sp. TWI432]